MLTELSATVFFNPFYITEHRSEFRERLKLREAQGTRRVK